MYEEGLLAILLCKSAIRHISQYIIIVGDMAIDDDANERMNERTMKKLK